MAWRIEYLRSARKSTDRLDAKTRQRVHDCLLNRVAVLDDPRVLAKPLKGDLASFWRFRVGHYRIICDIQDDKLVILVITIGHRKDVYQ